MNGEATDPEGFVLSAQLALKDLEDGIDKKNGRAIQGPFKDLTCQPPMVYRLLNGEIPTIGDLFFPTDLAQQIRTVWNEDNTQRPSA